MIKKLLILFVILIMSFPISAQITDTNYRVYDAQGNGATVARMFERAAQSDVIFLGENHDDAATHFLQLQILKKVFETVGKNRKVALSLEMFERDVQIVLNEYLTDLITEKKFLDDSRPWNNYQTDYRPLVEFAKTNKLKVIAANAPRRYINMVARNGREAVDRLSPAAKDWLAPLPFTAASEAYTKKFMSLMKSMNGDSHNLKRILDSQTLWDATMAYSIAEHLKSSPNGLVIHLNGGFHSEHRLGAVEQLTNFDPKVKILVITIKPDENFTVFDKSKHENAGDFVILTDAKIPRSSEGGK